MKAGTRHRACLTVAGMTDADRPAPGLEPNDIASPRASDADREAVADRLRIAAGEGRIELWELDERLGQAYGARTYGELAALVDDLPGQQRADVAERPGDQLGQADTGAAG